MDARSRVPSGFTATTPDVSGTCLTQTRIFIFKTILINSYMIMFSFFAWNVNSSRNFGSAIAIRALVLSPRVFPLSLAIPYSVTMQSTSFLLVDTCAPGVSVDFTVCSRGWKCDIASSSFRLYSTADKVSLSSRSGDMLGTE